MLLEMVQYAVPSFFLRLETERFAIAQKKHPINPDASKSCASRGSNPGHPD